ncbi:hypothetical protein GGE24_004204 [Bradyrhizobium centrosematis]|nr:hypothetical protein [Bradyrhizobium centrosematis]MCS3774865.1 hypothetical protein [Bradyrhizobium centrosematis]
MTNNIYSDPRNNAASIIWRRRFYFSRSLPTLCTNGVQDASYQSFDKGENNA